MTRILITVPNEDLVRSDFLTTDRLRYEPSLARAPENELLATLVRQNISALIAPHRPSADLFRAWSDAVPSAAFVSYVVGVAARPVPGAHIEHRLRDTSLDSIADALQYYERECATIHLGLNTDGPWWWQRDPAVLVGAGIVNLITAIHLVENGYPVTVLDQSPPPGHQDWLRYGCTHAGDDARMFTFTEMDSYTNRSPTAGTSRNFRTMVEDGGWLLPDRPLTADERVWIDEHERLPSWLGRAYNEDIFGFTVEAHHEWERLRRRYPMLFTDVGFRPDVLRLYSDSEQLDAAQREHRRIGAVERELTPAALVRRYPALSDSVRAGAIAGGFVVRGFTVNVHRFAAKIVDFLIERGARFHWNTPVNAVSRSVDGVITGFDCAVEIPRQAHVVASPGVYGRSLLRDTPCEGKIHGVLGGWARISNAQAGLANSLKIARKGHATEDANVTVGADGAGNPVLIVGSGYGYLGERVDDVQMSSLGAIERGIADTIDQIFPDRGPLARSSRPGDDYRFKFCVRPWTATSLGLFHAERTGTDRLFVINGGHNTGGFAQAPTIARAVLAALTGAPHPMHALYHPRRLPDFLGVAEPVHATSANALVAQP